MAPRASSFPLTIDRLLGLLAATSGRIDAALAHFADGLAFCDRAGYRPEYAGLPPTTRTPCSQQGAGGRGKAVALQDEALEIARELGMRPLTERVLAREQLLGHSVESRPREASPAYCPWLVH